VDILLVIFYTSSPWLLRTIKAPEDRIHAVLGTEGEEGLKQNPASGRSALRPPAACLIVLLFCAFLPPAWATVELAEKTGKDCAVCHLNPSGGGELTPAGREHLPRPSFGDHAARYGRLAIRYIHILGAFFWFGTILYAHLVLKLSSAAYGLPGELVRIGLVSIAVISVTGTILAIKRFPSLSSVTETSFGVLFLIKVGLFLVMALSALFTVLVLRPKLNRSKAKKLPDPAKGLDHYDLASFDGEQGKSAYIAYKGKVYDVSSSPLWTAGRHFGRHQAGLDLTAMLGQAPHGDDRLQGLPLVGDLAEDRKHALAGIKVFYFIAYLNLALVFLILFILALWRWT
jgi:predicted heme/steroid binding protein/uncharacterized membrane protein